VFETKCSSFLYLKNVKCQLKSLLQHTNICWFLLFIMYVGNVCLFTLSSYVCVSSGVGILRGPCSVNKYKPIILRNKYITIYGSIKDESRLLCSMLSSCIVYSRLQRVTIPDAVIIQFVLLKMDMLMLDTCRGL
jgi:hypothetical protein